MSPAPAAASLSSSPLPRGCGDRPDRRALHQRQRETSEHQLGPAPHRSDAEDTPMRSAVVFMVVAMVAFSLSFLFSATTTTTSSTTTDVASSSPHDSDFAATPSASSATTGPAASADSVHSPTLVTQQQQTVGTQDAGLGMGFDLIDSVFGFSSPSSPIHTLLQPREQVSARPAPLLEQLSCPFSITSPLILRQCMRGCPPVLASPSPQPLTQPPRAAASCSPPTRACLPLLLGSRGEYPTIPGYWMHMESSFKRTTTRFLAAFYPRVPTAVFQLPSWIHLLHPLPAMREPYVTSMSYLARLSIWLFGSPFFLYECACILLSAVHYFVVVRYSVHALRFVYNLVRAARLVYLVHYATQRTANSSSACAAIERILQEQESLVNAKSRGGNSGKTGKGGRTSGGGKSTNKTATKLQGSLAGPSTEIPVHVCPQCTSHVNRDNTRVIRGPLGTEWQIPTSMLPEITPARNPEMHQAPPVMTLKSVLRSTHGASRSSLDSPPPPMSFTRLVRSFVTCLWICVCLYLDMRIDPSLKKHILPSLASSFHLWASPSPAPPSHGPGSASSQETHLPAATELPCQPSASTRTALPPTPPSVPTASVPTTTKRSHIAAPRPAARSLGLSKRNKLATLARALAAKSVPPAGSTALAPPPPAPAAAPVLPVVKRVAALLDHVVSDDSPVVETPVVASAELHNGDALELASLPVFDTAQIVQQAGLADDALVETRPPLPLADPLPPVPCVADALVSVPLADVGQDLDELEIAMLPVFDTSVAALALAQHQTGGLDVYPNIAPVLSILDTADTDQAGHVQQCIDSADEAHDGGSDSGVDDVTDDEEHELSNMDDRSAGPGRIPTTAIDKHAPDSPMDPVPTALAPDMDLATERGDFTDLVDEWSMEDMVLDLSNPEIAAAAFIYSLHAGV